jgi:hypothetical protein
MKRLLFALAGGLMVLAGPGPGRAAPRVEADPNKEYPVSPEVGPWMVCTAAFTGEHARSLAHQLVIQLRRRDNLPAYSFSRNEEERRQREELIARLRQQDPNAHLRPDIRRLPRIKQEYIVLVGGWPDMEAANKALKEIKKLKPPELYLPDGSPGLDIISSYEPTKNGYVVKRAYANPFANAFVSRNPTVPQDKPDPSKPDPFLKELNAGEEYSLLKCSKPWTLLVKDFQGHTTLQQRSPTNSFLDKLGLAGESGKVLNASALQAHELAKALRSLKDEKYDAYVLHTRYGSLVCVGGYESPEDRQLQRTAQTLAKLQLGVVQLYARPVPMPVPRP